MLSHKEVLQALVKGVNGGGAVSVRETNFGYVIRSESAQSSSSVRGRVGRFILAAMVVAAVGVWITPFGAHAFPVTVLLSLLFLAIGYVSFAMIRASQAGFELHVDTNRRELRSAVLTAKGESWIRSSARFGEVSDVFMRKPTPESEMRSLCLRIIGEDVTMPVAVGKESTLLALHKRLMSDLRPIEERLAGYQFQSAGQNARSSVFPQIGPDELPV